MGKDDRNVQNPYEDKDNAKLNEAAHLRSNAVDVEAQTREAAEIPAAEYHVPLATKYLYLTIYFALNVALTICNKAVLGKVRSFPRNPESLHPALTRILLTTRRLSSPSHGC